MLLSLSLMVCCVTLPFVYVSHGMYSSHGMLLETRAVQASFCRPIGGTVGILGAQ